MATIVRVVSLSVIVITSLSGCRTIASMAGAQRQANRAEAIIEKDLGAKAQIGWRVRNGVLVDVTVSLGGPNISHLTVGDLQAEVRHAVSVAFKHPPQTITIAFNANL